VVVRLVGDGGRAAGCLAGSEQCAGRGGGRSEWGGGIAACRQPSAAAVCLPGALWAFALQTWQLLKCYCPPLQVKNEEFAVVEATAGAAEEAAVAPAADGAQEPAAAATPAEEGAASEPATANGASTEAAAPAVSAGPEEKPAAREPPPKPTQIFFSGAPTTVKREDVEEIFQPYGKVGRQQGRGWVGQGRPPLLYLSLPSASGTCCCGGRLPAAWRTHLCPVTHAHCRSCFLLPARLPACRLWGWSWCSTPPPASPAAPALCAMLTGSLPWKPSLR
jgi:hypothetical protein